MDERNRIDYLPYEIELLTRFGQLLTRLQDDLSTEIKVVDDRLNVGLPTGYTPGTAVSGLVDRLEPPRVYRRVKLSKDEPYDTTQTYPVLYG